ncbi:hypothetical protein RND71_036715 [Anisodus tanguticus]|uniref:Uncharacterized protein n=1 Tax=Anisodus tanguticus TaxID=243964 RepID=A0AAE1R277_9SOLA|nr:hypothetical protein RND71_036715 [Anisodus tanguticus]
MSNSISWSQVTIDFYICNEINTKELQLDHSVVTPQVDVLEVSGSSPEYEKILDRSASPKNGFYTAVTCENLIPNTETKYLIRFIYRTRLLICDEGDAIDAFDVNNLDLFPRTSAFGYNCLHSLRTYQPWTPNAEISVTSNKESTSGLDHILAISTLYGSDTKLSSGLDHKFGDNRQRRNRDIRN